MIEQLPPKVAFWSGLVGGVLVVGTLGFFVLLGVVVKGGKISLASSGGTPARAADAPTVAPTPLPDEAPSAPIKVEINDSDHLRGPKNAKVTLVEYSDFECPFCGRFYPTVKQLLDEYGDKVRFVYRHFPLDSIHPQARPAAEASECAAEQGKFWEFHDGLFENQERLGSALYTELAGKLKLNKKKFDECVSSRKYQQKVESDLQTGVSQGTRGTPHTLINGVSVSGAVPYAQLKAIVDQALQ